jgi:hypothetical protein
MVQGLTVFKMFNLDQVSIAKEAISKIENERWVTRTDLALGRGIDGATCHYDFCGHAQMSAEVKSTLKLLAPKFKDFTLAEVCVNRYNITDYIGKHRDRHIYRRNLVISMQELGDGLLLDETNEMVNDKIGQAVLFEGIGPIHSVPPVKNQRFSLIYLYE